MKKQIRIVADKNSPTKVGNRIILDLTIKANCKFLFGKHWKEIWKDAVEKKNPQPKYELTAMGTKSKYVITSKK